MSLAVKLKVETGISIFLIHEKEVRATIDIIRQNM